MILISQGIANNSHIKPEISSGLIQVRHDYDISAKMSHAPRSKKGLEILRSGLRQGIANSQINSSRNNWESAWVEREFD